MQNQALLQDLVACVIDKYSVVPRRHDAELLCFPGGASLDIGRLVGVDSQGGFRSVIAFVMMRPGGEEQPRAGTDLRVSAKSFAERTTLET